MYIYDINQFKIGNTVTELNAKLDSQDRHRLTDLSRFLSRLASKFELRANMAKNCLYKSLGLAKHYEFKDEKPIKVAKSSYEKDYRPM
jgi:hypothetical protein